MVLNEHVVYLAVGISGRLGVFAWQIVGGYNYSPVASGLALSKYLTESKMILRRTWSEYLTSFLAALAISVRYTEYTQ